MIPFVPNKFTSLRNLDMEDINDNLDATFRSIKSSLDKRYTYSSHTFPIDGITEASAEVLRAAPIRRPKTTSGLVEVCGVEVVIYAAGAVVWTLACSDPTWPSITVTAAGATTEAHASSGMPVQVPSTSADVTFTMSAASASTITRGYIVIHTRCDRHVDGTGQGYVDPTLLTSLSSTAGATLDTELGFVDSCTLRDTESDIDLRCTSMTVRGLAGTAAVLTMPQGVFRIHRVTGYVVSPVATDLSVSLASATFTTVAFTVTATGATARAASGADAGADAVPIVNFSQDMTLTLARSGGAGTIALAHVVVWWS